MEAHDSDGDTELLFSLSDFGRVRRLLHDHSGIALAESKRGMVYDRLARRLRVHGLTRFDDYLDIVDADANEWEACVNALSADLPSFFREPHHFAIMADYVKRRQFPRLRVWCAAASTGEEPYSIAMSMIEAYNTDTPPVEIIASDIDTDVLAHAQRGVYGLERLAGVSERRRARFFQLGDGPNTGFARVRPLLRTMIDYRRFNLRDATWPLPAGLDIIVCRNVMVDFEQAARHRILVRFGSLVTEDGLLIIGHSENIGFANGPFAPLGQTVYRPNAGSRLVGGASRSL